jgi:anti-sigma factor RsiW
MSCRRTAKLLSTYIDGACSAQERARVEGHIDGCADCAALLRELQRTVELVSQLPEQRTSDQFMAALTPKLRELEQMREPGLLRRVAQWLADSQIRWQAATAGAVVLVLAVGFFGMTNHGGGTPTASSPDAPVTAVASDEYSSNVVERHRRLVATTLPFDDQALIYAGYEGGI